MYDVPEVQNSYEIINMRGTVRMKIRDILAKNEPTLSFEVFPPKTEKDIPAEHTLSHRYV